MHVWDHGTRCCLLDAVISQGLVFSGTLVFVCVSPRDTSQRKCYYQALASPAKGGGLEHVNVTVELVELLVSCFILNEPLIKQRKEWQQSLIGDYTLRVIRHMISSLFNQHFQCSFCFLQNHFFGPNLSRCYCIPVLIEVSVLTVSHAF